MPYCIVRSGRNSDMALSSMTLQYLITLLDLIVINALLCCLVYIISGKQ